MFGWFDLAWPWIGLGLALILLLLLGTRVLRTSADVPRHRDLRWLSFLAIAVYMVHNVEEYGIAADGAWHAFPDSLCTLLGQDPYPGCAIPPAFYLFVNLPLVWIAAPAAAMLSPRNPLAGLTLWGVIGINALVHIVPAVALRQYDPGLLTAVLLFVPLTVLTARAAFGAAGPYRRLGLLVLLGAGVFMHAALAGSVVLFLPGAIPAWLLLVIQPASIALGYLGVGMADRRLRR